MQDKEFLLLMEMIQNSGWWRLGCYSPKVLFIVLSGSF